MTRLSLLVVGLALAGATGCAQCDTCDDFPAPCTGPNCGQPVYNTSGFIPPTQDGLPGGAARMTPPVDDQAPDMNNPGSAGPDMPSPTMPPTAAPGANTPPPPTDPGR